MTSALFSALEFAGFSASVYAFGYGNGYLIGAAQWLAAFVLLGIWEVATWTWLFVQAGSFSAFVAEITISPSASVWTWAGLAAYCAGYFVTWYVGLRAGRRRRQKPPKKSPVPSQEELDHAYVLMAAYANNGSWGEGR